MQFLSKARRAALAAAAVALATGAGGCYDFHLTGPEDAAPAASPNVVTVAIEYRQPSECVSVSRCADNVVFFGSWMRPGAEFLLKADPGSHLWVGTAQNVPVNFPPNGEPYRVKVYDPYLRDTLTEGFSAERLVLGGQRVLTIDGSGGRNEAGLVYIDQQGQARNAY